MHKLFIIASLLHSVIFRGLLFNHYQQSYSTAIYIRKFIAGSMFDLVLIMGLVVIGLGINFITHKRRFIGPFYLIALTGMIILNIVNFYMASYFPDGLATWGMLFEYIGDLSVLAGTGVGELSIMPILLMSISVLVFFIPVGKRKDFTAKKKMVGLLIVVVFLLGANVIAKKVRVNKYHILGDNTIIRMFKNQKGDRDRALLLAGKTAVISEELRTKLLRPSNNKKLNVFSEKPNVIFLVLETVSAYETWIGEINDEFKLGQHKHEYTPFLNSLMKKGMTFTNFFGHSDYTAGGQTATLCSVYDSLRVDDGESSIMRHLFGLKFKCLPEYLKEEGYTNFFFNGYTKEFDNKVNFLSLHGMDHFYCREEIKAEFGFEPVGNWGQQDDKVLEALIHKADQMEGKPFSAMFMSVNTHSPYTIGKDHPLIKGASDYLNALHWTDRHIEEFFGKIQDRPWFQNTLFVLLADNGTMVRSPKKSDDMYNHLVGTKIPFMLYHPNNEFFKGVKKQFAAQVDIAPTIMHLLGIEKKDHFVGESLFAEKRRDYVYLYRWHRRHYFYNGDWVVSGVDGKFTPVKPGATNPGIDFVQMRKDYASILLQNLYGE